MNFFSLFKRNLLYILKKKINIDLENIEKLSLDDLFSYYDTDKANFIKSKKEPGHGFSKFYETHLNLFKEKKINILEIGSYSGAAAAAFVKYFPNSEIYCLDINLRNFKYSSKKIHPYGTDVSNKKMMLKFLSKINFFDSIKYFDFIIDDGSHIQSDQLIALNFFYKYVSNNGFYIIEDYCFAEYFKRNNDVEDYKVSEIISFINNKANFSSKIITNETINEINSSIKKVHFYKGNTDFSDIVFFEKN